MTLRRIDTDDTLNPPEPCRDPSHNPPSHIVLENGLWEHECPSCKRKQVFRVNRPTW